MTDNTIDYHSLTNQEILGEFVALHVILNASMLVDDLLNANLLSIDDVENHYYYPCPECGSEMILRDTKVVYRYFCTACDHSQKEEPEQEAQEVYEWWFVTEWLFEQLKAHGEPVINSRYGYLWGRGATGQAILLEQTRLVFYALSAMRGHGKAKTRGGDTYALLLSRF
jgi:predicted RNA-binding Zn-ribbon protein involved in translation (DUF1610 family)